MAGSAFEQWVATRMRISHVPIRRLVGSIDSGMDYGILGNNYCDRITRHKEPARLAARLCISSTCGAPHTEITDSGT